MKYNWWLWQSELSDKVVDGIIEKCETYSEEDGVIEPELDDVDNRGVLNTSFRRSKVRWVNDEPELRKYIWKYGLSANDNAFGFDIIDKFDIQYTTYHSIDKGCYNWHSDNEWMKEGYYDRKISVVIQLNDPSDYEGGKFEFNIDGEVFSPEGFEKKGSIIAFPSFMKHRVTEVTKGTRNSIVSWIQGPHFR